MERLREERDGLVLYNAGLPRFRSNFARDGILSAILLEDPKVLEAQLRFCALQQGKKSDPYTGEEPGKIFHEIPEAVIEGLSTKFNACDTTGLYLLGHALYTKISGDRSLLEDLRNSIEDAITYVKSHIKEGFFIESPSFSGAERFALRVTYWKDSIVIGRKGGEPNYPVVYPLAHLQNLAGIRSIAEVLDREDLRSLAHEMIKVIPSLLGPTTGAFAIARDQEGVVEAISSDCLHALFYLEKGDLSEEQIAAQEQASGVLETKAGYRTMEPASAIFAFDSYHASTVWPFEQAFIHAGAKKFGLDRVAEIATRVIPYLDTDAEILEIEGDEMKKGGCDPQLWTIAAKRYFSRVL